MILINLLPHREAARQRQQRQFHAQLVLSVLLGCLVSAAVLGVFQHRTDSQRARNQFLQREMTRLDADLQGMARLQMESDALRERRGILEHLQHQRKLPVHLLQELALQIPEGVYLNSLRQVRQSILLTGLAPSQERVTELLHNLNSSDWLSQPELVEIAATRADQPEGDPVRRTRFTISVTWGPESRHVGVQQGVPSVVHQRP